MTVIYDANWFDMFRKVAVTQLSNIEVGKTYYTNSFPDVFTVEKLLTNSESYSMAGLVYDGNDGDDVAWVLTTDGGRWSLRDLNVTEKPYNPWMIFTDVKIRDACKHLLNTTVIPSSDYDYDYCD